MANEQSSKINKTMTIAGMAIGGTVQTVSADLAVTFSKTLPTGTNHRIDLSIPVAAIKAVAIEADNDCTIKTNETVEPPDEIELKAKQPLIWATGDPAELLYLTTDVTAFYVTTTTSTLLKFGAAIDSTPVVNP
jgi:hypothetical protein